MGAGTSAASGGDDSVAPGAVDTTRGGLFRRRLRRKPDAQNHVRNILCRIDLDSLQTEARSLVKQFDDAATNLWDLWDRVQRLIKRRNELEEWLESGSHYRLDEAVAEAGKLELDVEELQGKLKQGEELLAKLSKTRHAVRLARAEMPSFATYYLFILNSTPPVSSHVLRLGGRLASCHYSMSLLDKFGEQNRLTTCVTYFWRTDPLEGVDAEALGKSRQYVTDSTLLRLLDNVPGEVLTSLAQDWRALVDDRQETVTDFIVSFIRVLAERDPSAVMRFAAGSIKDGSIERLHPRVRTSLSDVFYQCSVMLRAQSLDEKDTKTE